MSGRVKRRKLSALEEGQDAIARDVLRLLNHRSIVLDYHCACISAHEVSYQICYHLAFVSSLKTKCFK